MEKLGGGEGRVGGGGNVRGRGKWRGNIGGGGSGGGRGKCWGEGEVEAGAEREVSKYSPPLAVSAESVRENVQH